MAERKAFPLRLPPALLDELARWAADDLRSVNAQIEFLLREAVRKLAGSYGREYIEAKSRAGEKTTELWQDMGKHGYLGVSIPEEFGGGGDDFGQSGVSSQRKPAMAGAGGKRDDMDDEIPF